MNWRTMAVAAVEPVAAKSDVQYAFEFFLRAMTESDVSPLAGCTVPAFRLTCGLLLSAFAFTETLLLGHLCEGAQKRLCCTHRDVLTGVPGTLNSN